MTTAHAIVAFCVLIVAVSFFMLWAEGRRP